MATFTWVPDQGASCTPKLRVLSAKFGDGYEQRTADGINSVEEVWTLNFTLRSKAEIDAAYNFLKARKGVSNFDWTTPFGDALKFKCNTFSRTANYDTNAAMTATFEQVFET